MTAQAAAPLLDIASLSSATVRASEKVETLNELLSRSYSGEDCSRFFADVLRACAVSSDQVKRLAYAFLERVSPKMNESSESALLLVNLIRKDLADRSPTVRIAALRLLIVPCIFRVTEEGMLSDALERFAVESSVMTRRAAGVFAIEAVKVGLIDVGQFLKIIIRIFESGQPMVLESGVVALQYVHSTERISDAELTEFLHPFYRSLVENFMVFEDETKVALSSLLVRYARLNFRVDDESEDFRALIEVFSIEAALCGSFAVVTACIESLLSLNQPIVPIDAVERVLATARDEESLTLFLRSMMTFAVKHKEFEAILPRIFVTASVDSAQLMEVKLDFIRILISEGTCVTILKELEVYLRTIGHREVRIKVVNIAVEIALRFPDRLPTILKGLLSVIDDEVVAGVRVLFTKARDQFSQSSIVHFARIFPHLHSASAKANILWMLTQFHDDFPVIFPDFIRSTNHVQIFSDGFDVQIHFLILAGKVWSFHVNGTNEISQCILPRLELIVDYIYRYAIAESDDELVRDLAATLQSLMGDSLNKGPIMAKMFRELELNRGEVYEPEVSTASQSSISEFPCSSVSFYTGKIFPGLHVLPQFQTETRNFTARQAERKRSTPVFSAEASCSHHMSQSVGIPARLKQPLVAKQAVASSLADLDSFFDRAESPDSMTKEDCSASVQSVSPSVSAKPLIDLSAGADFGSLFKNK